MIYTEKYAYTINLNHMTQTNETTGRVRRLRRKEIPNTDGLLASLIEALDNERRESRQRQCHMDNLNQQIRDLTWINSQLQNQLANEQD